MSGFISHPACIPPYLIAGGRSSRMGFNKAEALLGDMTLAARIAARIGRSQTVPVTLNGDCDWPDAAGLRRVPDTVPGRLGPLAGVLTALRDMPDVRPDTTHILTLPVDSPFFPSDLVARLAEAVDSVDGIAIASSQGREHPVFGLWPVAIADDLEAWLLIDEKRRVRDFLSRHRVRYVDFPMIETPIGSLDPFFNINTPDDLAAAETWLRAAEASASW